MMTPAQMDDVYAALVSADGDQDAEALASLCWQLYGELGTVQARADALQLRFSAIAQILGREPAASTVVGEFRPAVVGGHAASPTAAAAVGKAADQ